MNRFKVLLFACIVLLEAIPKVLAHGDVHEQIVELTQRIKAEPKNAVLYHKRGELHRAHGSHPEALLDYAEAEKLDPKLDVVILSRGRTFFEASKWTEALHELNTFLIRHPEHHQGRWLRGQVAAKMNMRAHAEVDFRMVLKSTTEPSPDQFIERANNLVLWGDQHKGAALKVVQEGIEKLGPLITLEMTALDLEVASKEYNAAHRRIDALLEGAERKETYLVRKAEIFEQEGKRDQSREYYGKAMEAIHNLKPHQRKLKAVVQLENQIRSHLGN